MEAPERILRDNVRYHDLAAADYDYKWGISFGQLGQEQVVGKLRKALGAEPGPYALDESADELGLDVDTAVCDAAALPFADASFDLVFGHAVLHHLPDLDAAFAEFRRVLRPGGALAFCGEPSRHGDRLAELPKRGAHALAPLWRALMRADARKNGAESAPSELGRLEHSVDVHAFTPAELAASARRAGFDSPRVSGEELAASLFGWVNRALEATADPNQVPRSWRLYAHRGYLALQRVDRALLEPYLPPAIFYNLLISARVPG
jgi:SAM-dependent methyltransferase